MELPAAVDAAKKKGLRLPKVDKPFVEPSEDKKYWINHPDGGGRLGMGAARSVVEGHNYVDSRYIDERYRWGRLHCLRCRSSCSTRRSSLM